MVSATLNVLRWSVFGAGIAYGFMHNRTLANDAATQQAKAEYARKEALIVQAKAKWAELQAKKEQRPTQDVVTDINDANFDVVKALDYAIENLKE